MKFLLDILFFQAEDGIRDSVASRGLGDVYKRQVHAFEKKGYLKEISINSDKSYFDTNTSVHHHFYDEDTNELIDCDENEIDPVNIKKNITGKKINSVEVLVKVASDNQNQK